MSCNYELPVPVSKSIENDNRFNLEDLKCHGNCFYCSYDTNEGILYCKENKDSIYSLQGMCSKWTWDNKTSFLRRGYEY